MSTEWKDQRAKCEGDAVLIGHINKCSEVLISQSHVDTLAQVLALVDEKGYHTGPRPRRSEPSPVLNHQSIV